MDYDMDQQADRSEANAQDSIVNNPIHAPVFRRRKTARYPVEKVDKSGPAAAAVRNDISAGYSGPDFGNSIIGRGLSWFNDAGKYMEQLEDKNRSMSDLIDAHYFSKQDDFRATGNRRLIDDLRAANEQHERLRDVLTSEVGRLQERIRIADVNNPTVENVVTMGALVSLNAQVTDLMEVLKKKCDIIAQLTTDNDGAKDVIAKLQSKLGSMEKEMAHICAQMGFNKTTDVGGNYANTAKAHIDKLEARIKLILTEGERLEGENKVMSDAYIEKTVEHEREILDLWDDKRKLREENEKFRAQLKHFETGLEDFGPPTLAAKITSLTAEISNLSDHNENLELHVSTMVQKLESERAIVAMQERVHKAAIEKLNADNIAAASARHFNRIAVAARSAIPMAPMVPAASPLETEEALDLKNQIALLRAEKEDLRLDNERVRLTTETQKQKAEINAREVAEAAKRRWAKRFDLRNKCDDLKEERDLTKKILYATLHGIPYTTWYDPFVNGPPKFDGTHFGSPCSFDSDEGFVVSDYAAHPDSSGVGPPASPGGRADPAPNGGGGPRGNGAGSNSGNHLAADVEVTHPSFAGFGM